MRILVTGGAGFIGSEFVRQIVLRKYKIIVLDSLTYAGDISRIKEVLNDISFYNADIRDENSVKSIFKKERPNIVVHWAAESHVDRSILNSTPFLDTNIIGTKVLLEMSKTYKIERFINISTDEVYGELGKDGKFDETSPLNPNSPYSVSKAASDMLGRAYYRTYGLPVITVRPSNNYGPWQYPEKLIPVVILKALNNEKVPVYARGENVREWLYVSDCADAVIKIMENGIDGEIYNVGSGEEKKNIDVVKEILRILNITDDIIEFVKDRPGHDFRYSLNSKKIKKQIGWQKNVNFSTGIRKTVNWYLENIRWVKEKVKHLKKYWGKVYGR
jgi:dTDP-glucose 4,6-dehydratase